jgi:uncharacterized protein
LKIRLVNNQNKEDAFYTRLKGELEKGTAWPSAYLYKFIITSNLEKKEEIEAVFNHLGAVISTKKSSNGKYMSISIMVQLKNADEVIAYYKKINTIEGVISL